MGMEQRVTLPAAGCPHWSAIAAVLEGVGYPVQMRMIDGELAFPEETPPENWKEVRVGTPAGMITLRRDARAIDLVTWGNADEALVRAWNALTWAVARASGGFVLIDRLPVSPEDYAARHSLPW